LDLQIDRKDWIECKARNQQDRQCTHNVTLRHIVQLLLQWKSNEYYVFWLCVSSLRYAACNVHVPYCHLWPAWLYYIFSHCLINGKKKKKVTNVKCVFWFSLQLLSETFLILGRIEWDKKMYIGFHVKYLLFLSNFNDTVIFSTYFQKMLEYCIS
jgi:hypothetical protein